MAHYPSLETKNEFAKEHLIAKGLAEGRRHDGGLSLLNRRLNETFQTWASAMKICNSSDASQYEANDSVSESGDSDFSDLLRCFINRLHHRQDALLIVLGRGDTATALSLLHQLEGTSAMYGLHDVGHRASEIAVAVIRHDLRAALSLTHSLDDPRLFLSDQRR